MVYSKLKWFVIAISSAVMLVSLSACSYVKDPKENRGQIPRGTKASVNFLDKQLIVINKNGQRVNPVASNGKGETVLEGTLRFKQVNPCYMEWCPSGSPCMLFLISPGSCPTE